MEGCYLDWPKKQDSSGPGANLDLPGNVVSKYKNPITPEIRRERWWGMGSPEMEYGADYVPENGDTECSGNCPTKNFLRDFCQLL